jgi:hypothetical protein
MREWCKYCVYIHINAKMIPVETIPRMGQAKKENGRGGEFNYDIFDVL